MSFCIRRGVSSNSCSITRRIYSGKYSKITDQVHLDSNNRLHTRFLSSLIRELLRAAGRHWRIGQYGHTFWDSCLSVPGVFRSNCFRLRQANAAVFSMESVPLFFNITCIARQRELCPGILVAWQSENFLPGFSLPSGWIVVVNGRSGFLIRTKKIGGIKTAVK